VVDSSRVKFDKIIVLGNKNPGFSERPLDMAGICRTEQT
jgi:hypothetical protein